MSVKRVGNLAWFSAMMGVTAGNMSHLAELLENEAFEFDMEKRRKLAKALTARKKKGPKSKAVRDLDFYREVTSFKLSNGIKKLPDVELKRFAKTYGLYASDTIDTALKNGKWISNMLAQIDAENEPQEDDG